MPDAQQVTSVLGDTVMDTIQSTSESTGKAQFPKHVLTGPAATPASGPASAPRHLATPPLQPAGGDCCVPERRVHCVGLLPSCLICLCISPRCQSSQQFK